MRYSTPKTTIVMNHARRMSWIWRAAGVLKLKLGSAIAKFKTRATRNPATNAPTLGRFARRGVGGGVMSAGPDALSRSQVVERKRDQHEDARVLLRGQTEGDNVIVPDELHTETKDRVARDPELQEVAVLEPRVGAQRDEDPEPRETERGVVERGRVDQ